MSKKTSKFKVGDRVRRLNTNEDVIKGRIYVIRELTRYGDVELEGKINFGYNPDNFELVESSPLELVSPKKLKRKDDDILIKIKKMDLDEIKTFDNKVLADAKKEILKERAEKDKKDAMDYMRGQYQKQDEANAVVKKAQKELDKADANLTELNKK